MLISIEITHTTMYISYMKTQTELQTRKFVPGARPPKRLSAAAKKQLDEMRPSVKAHEMAARFARSKVNVRP